MIGLGVLSNQPATPSQPADGIHLRWGCPRELGFPWHGFYLFRHPALPGRPLCLSSVTGGLKKGVWPDTKYYSAIGLVSSSENLVLTDDFTPANQVEFALDRRNFLRFDLRAGELARRIELRIAFHAKCVDFGKLISVPPAAPPSAPPNRVLKSNPLTLEDVTFEVRAGFLSTNTRFEVLNTSSGPLVALNCEEGLTIKLPSPVNSVELLMTRTVSPATLPANLIEAYDSNNKKVATAILQSAANQPQTVKLAGQNIIRVEVTEFSGIRAFRYLHRICFDRLPAEGDGKKAIKVRAFSGGTPVRSSNVNYQAGEIVSVILEADAIDAVELGPGEAALIDLCYVPVAQDATQGWEKLPNQRLSKNITLGLTYPIGLPVLQTDYPCSVSNPQSLMTQRVRYALPPEWDGSTFTQLHDQLVELVKGGPSTAPMVDRIFAAPPAVSNPPDLNPPTLSRFYILDMILLGALHPALAQLVGLYWVDQTALPDVAYDYLIVADHTGVGQRDADKVLAVIKSSGFAQLDGYIVFNKRAAAAPPLPAPSGLQTFELPGGTFPDLQGQLPPASNNAGLRWDLGDDSDGLLPDSAVMYLVWRANLGNAATPAPAGTYDLVTKIPPDKPKPILVTEARLPNDPKPERSPDWPIIPHFIDRNLPDGWYSYKVSGIDLFGRYGQHSAPSQVLLRDKIPPPMPTAVEAYALDPEDRFLQRDEVYKNWYNQLDSPSPQTLVGLRVRWRWTPQHQQQTPDTKEFRIYFHPGADLPLDQDQAINWQERYYVVGYDDNVTVDSLTGERAYEILLPPPTEPNPTSIPLNPSLAVPVVYAHIGVSAADDKVHTNDQRTTGNWSGRSGNEGPVGPPATIYRVLRTLPPAPEDVFAGERLKASPADYHDRSFFTYRWKPQQHLKLHVFRAMDDGVFKADWAQRPSVPLSQSQVQFFPAGWSQATRQSVAGELNPLNTFVGQENGEAKAMTYYRQLSDSALRVLAGLPSSESAFVQLTINPLPNPDDAANANRLGPDNPDDLVLDPSQRAFIDTLDGRSTNGYFYRAAFVDGAHNLGPLGLSSPPVYLPNVAPPRAPVLTKVLGGDRQITIQWASNREADLKEYRIYRTDNEEDTRDLRKMTLVRKEPIPSGDPLSRPAEVTWIDSPVPGLTTFFYRLAAADTASNVSPPSPAIMGRAFDDSHPDPPAWNPPAVGTTAGAVVLSWSSPITDLACLVQRGQSAGEWINISSWLARGTYTFTDTGRLPATTYDYRLVILDSDGRRNKNFNVLTVNP
jgi:hypothetical protein